MSDAEGIKAAKQIVASQGYRIPELPTAVIRKLEARAAGPTSPDASAADTGSKDTLPLKPELLFPISLVQVYACTHPRGEFRLVCVCVCVCV
jgi:hypothetical protein